MTDETTEAAEGPKGLREALDRKEAELAEERTRNTELTSKLMQSAFKEAGLNPLEGLGKAVAKLYEGEPDAAAVAQFAKEEYGWSGSAQTSSADTASAVAAGQQRVDSALAGSSPITAEPELRQQIQEAERAGDWTTALALKTRALKDIPIKE